MTFRQLPSVHSLLEREDVEAAIGIHGREAVLHALRGVLEQIRENLKTGQSASLDPAEISLLALHQLRDQGTKLRRVINATGVLLHTGLGRAPLAIEAAHAVHRVVQGYCNLELDLATGLRGERTVAVVELLRKLTGAQAAAVVNNNAAATILALRATAKDREVIVSRGQLVEIGGSFRLPEICEVSGAKLREVGTTNKTRLADYERAITLQTAALLRVHPSNYRVVGFTESVSIAELARLGQSRGLITIDDIGSGALNTHRPPSITDEPTVAEGLSAGADLVLFSGDKLLGGPQCGILVGNSAAIARVTTDPLMRALRVDKMTLVALEATLQLALQDRVNRIPLWKFLTTDVSELIDRAERLALRFRDELALTAIATETTARLGGGSMPIEPIRTAAVRWTVANETEVARRLRTAEIAVVPRIHDGAILFDLRAVDPEDDEAIFAAVRQLVDERAHCS